MQIPDIKKRLPIMSVLAHYGIKTDTNSHIKCPFHKDDKPSCKIYTDTNTYNCFGCGKTGDVIQFIQDKENCDKHTALKKAAELAGENTEVMGISSGKASVKEAENFAELFKMQKEGLPRSPKAQEYLRNRCLEQLQEVGYNSGVNWKKLKQCITFPLKDKNGNIVSLYGRRITESNGHNVEFGKHYYTANRKGLYPGCPDANTETLIITEAIIDAATLQLSIENNQYSILAAYGTNGLTAEHKAAIAEWASDGTEKQEIIFFFDGDTAGKEAAKKYSEELIKDKACLVSTVPTPDGEDINSLFVNYGKEAILQLIEERQPANLKTSQSTNNLTIEQYDNQINTTGEVQPQSVGGRTQCLASPLKTDTPNKIIHETPTARYIIKGSLPKTFDRMLVSLDVQHLETGVKYRCRLDLYEEKQTRKEAREASEKLDLRSDLVENDLSQLTDLLEEYRDNQLQQTTEENSSDKALSLPEQAKCKAFLQKDNLIQNLNELIGQSGIVGEENNRLFLFIIGTSHKMPDTLHALIQGSSGSGKTHLLSKIAALMPDERVVKFTRVTENSFYNYDEYFFRNKLICLEDIDGLKEEALFAWRELISNEQLSSSTSQKDENGNIRSAQRIVRGPMASICATTHGQIYEDNMSRMFIVAVDESSEQTQKIMNYQSKTASGTIEKGQEVEAKEFMQNCIRMLKPLKVVNPYADKINLPPQAHKIRRLHELFLSFVKQVALIHQYQRKRDDRGRIITDPEDLKIAVEIMFDSIFLKVDELDGSLRQFFEQLKAYVLAKENPQNYEFMQREIRHALNLNKTQLFRYLNELMELEYLQQSGGYANRGFKYKIIYWDNVTKLRSEIKAYLFGQIEKLAFQSVGTPVGTPENYIKN
ncbi:DNA primase [Salinivirga cyanobacteriivorans]|uniref:DNA primase n=1 Tax=Salinivirga cyanobacteriivorans TaxID=1307839 RepID=A0A0S2HV47_9BACT|nr:CHC2 zinc finger domain-containing protein [Salinivirga cyanobacteriivorans]ALO13939.1 DNA primase [Salinivirga cyanobacteriivorans]